ncbi:hypothetical protein SCARD494_07600 [Seiridium cardinale]
MGAAPQFPGLSFAGEDNLAHHLLSYHGLVLFIVYVVTSMSSETFRLATAPSYRALSYTWGPAKGRPEDQDSVFRCQFSPEMDSMSKKLVGTLTRIAQREKNEWYWIDFLCINQNIPREWGEQVNNMHIYQKAETVDVWLGSATEQDGSDINSSENLANGPKRSLPINHQQVISEEDWEILVSFFFSRWFHRLWTLQEFALARDVRFIYGDSFVDPVVLREAALHLYSHAVSMQLHCGNNGTAGAAVVPQNLLREPLQDVKQAIHYLSQLITKNDKLDYKALLVHDHACERRTLPSWVDEEHELPSWTPNLAFRESFPLSSHRAAPNNVFGSEVGLNQQRFHIDGNDLHVFGHRIGVVEKVSSPCLYTTELAPCIVFGWNVMPALKYFSESNCKMGNTLVEALFSSFGLGNWKAPTGGPNTRVPDFYDFE